MTEAQARTAANVVLATAAIGAAYYVLKTPPLRRKVWQIARAWAAGPLAAWAATEVRRAWDGSAAPRAVSAGQPATRTVDRPPYDTAGAGRQLSVGIATATDNGQVRAKPRS